MQPKASLTRQVSDAEQVAVPNIVESCAFTFLMFDGGEK
jgi:hypothetical protein